MNKILGILILLFLVNCSSTIIKPSYDIQMGIDTSCSQGYSQSIYIDGEQRAKKCITEQEWKDGLVFIIDGINEIREGK